TRLNIGFKAEKYNFRLSLQDVRVWGESRTKSDIAGFMLHEAWGEIRCSDHFTVKAGRQVLSYDDQRLLSETNWNNVASSHDLLLLKYSAVTKVHLGLAYNNDKEKYAESNYPVEFYKSLGYLWISKEPVKNLTASFITIADGNQKSGSESTIYLRSTSGLYVSCKSDSIPVSCILSGYYQYGKDITGINISAYLATLKMQYRIVKPLEVFAGADYFSGNNETKTGDNHNRAFSNLYGSGHRFLGNMDYFTTADTHTKGGGLADCFTGFGLMAHKAVKVSLTWHYFQLTGKLIDTVASGSMQTFSSRLGHEMDIVFDFRINEATNLQLGYCILQGTETMQYLKGGDRKLLNHWGYAMLVFKPDFL
ncbi:MAG: alginate export family protein, partial [Bacteroidetes bacterium]|nr:alginate export family protein [Bacteroidota bacterium]